MKTIKSPLFVMLIATLALALIVACGGGGSDDDAYAEGAFPPTLSDTPYHEPAWNQDDCLLCHEKGVNDAPVVKHEFMPEHIKQAKCRTCHVFVVGQEASD